MKLARTWRKELFARPCDEFRWMPYHEKVVTEHETMPNVIYRSYGVFAEFNRFRRGEMRAYMRVNILMLLD